MEGTDPAWLPLLAPGLDKFVEERIRRCRPDPASDTARGKCVLYWMRTAVRGHENPALDAAKQQARSAGVPLVVVAFVLSSHTHPTARRFKFWLEGLADAQAELQAQVPSCCPASHPAPLLCCVA